MLSEDQIDYLLQIKASKQIIPDDTVRVMLKALRWAPDEIERGIVFLNRPEAKEEQPKPLPVVAPEPTPTKPEPQVSSSIKIKQNPFPLGSPFTAGQKLHHEKRHRGIIFIGAFLGGIVFIVAIIIYARMSG